MVRHCPFGHFVAHRETQKDFRWNTLHLQGRVVPKAKPIVEGWFANQDATLRLQIPNDLQSFVDKCFANSPSLERRENSDRPECKPTVILPANLDRREGNLPHNIAIDFGHQGDGQGVVGSQRLDDQVFCLMTKGVIGKCCDENLSNDGVIAGCFGANNHVST